MSLRDLFRKDAGRERLKKVAGALSQRATVVSDRATVVASASKSNWDRLRADIDYAEEVALRRSGGPR